MPLIRIDELSDGSFLGLWNIVSDELNEEDVNYGISPLPRSKARRMEQAAVTRLVREMTCDGGIIVSHDKNGKPEIPGWNISISHTRGFAAVIISKDYNVGIDIEYISDRVNRIVEKFMRDDEVAEDTVSRLLVWSAKEALYKYFSEDALEYSEMRVMTFTPESSGEGQLAIANLKRQAQITVDYKITDDFVVTYIRGQE